MKSTQTSIIATSLTVGLLTLAPARIQAQPKALTVSLTATYQLPDVTSGADQNITTSSTKSVKFTTASILNLISNNLGMSLKGYTLIYDPFANGIGVTNKTTGDFQDASSFLTIDTSGSQVYSGSANSDTGRQGETYTTYVVITFDDGNGNAFTVDGLIKSTFSQPAPTAAQSNNGVTPNATTSFSGTVNGYGTVFGSDQSIDTAVFTGSVSGGGSGQGS
jgi:hypothetical protein